ncbi:MAG: hypothetical protein QW739_00125 [Candidatus Odinarchaeota archaeon]
MSLCSKTGYYFNPGIGSVRFEIMRMVIRLVSNTLIKCVKCLKPVNAVNVK